MGQVYNLRLVEVTNSNHFWFQSVTETRIGPVTLIEEFLS